MVSPDISESQYSYQSTIKTLTFFYAGYSYELIKNGFSRDILNIIDNLRGFIVNILILLLRMKQFMRSTRVYQLYGKNYVCTYCNFEESFVKNGSYYRSKSRNSNNSSIYAENNGLNLGRINQYLVLVGLGFGKVQKQIEKLIRMKNVDLDFIFR